MLTLKQARQLLVIFQGLVTEVTQEYPPPRSTRSSLTQQQATTTNNPIPPDVPKLKKQQDEEKEVNFIVSGMNYEPVPSDKKEAFIGSDLDGDSLHVRIMKRVMHWKYHHFVENNEEEEPFMVNVNEDIDSRYYLSSFTEAFYPKGWLASVHIHVPALELLATTGMTSIAMIDSSAVSGIFAAMEKQNTQYLTCSMYNAFHRLGKSIFDKKMSRFYSKCGFALVYHSSVAAFGHNQMSL